MLCSFISMATMLRAPADCLVLDGFKTDGLGLHGIVVIAFHHAKQLEQKAFTHLFILLCQISYQR